MPSHVFTTLEKLLAYELNDSTPETNNNYNEQVRFWTRAWKKHVEKHGNVPFIVRRNSLDVAYRNDVKHGLYTSYQKELEKQSKYDSEEKKVSRRKS